MAMLAAASVAGSVFATLCALLYFRQESFIFFPGPNDPALLERWRASRIEIPAAGLTLEGWWSENPGADDGAPVIVYFGGNAEDVLYTAGSVRLLAARRMLVVNYRGYGNTGGRPGQAALFEDALAVYEYLVAVAGVEPEDIVPMGRSLGSAMAAMLASERTVRAAVLITPFDSLAEVAARHYALFPVRTLLKHPFPSTQYAARARVPALMLAGEHDRIVPPVHAERLRTAWAAYSELHVLDGAGHNDIETHPAYYSLVNDFLRRTSVRTGSSIEIGVQH